ncbi:MAG: cell division protein FtsL [Spirochaetaceae bacterium]|jgi:cell division protein FtsL|nr:cell division protein FtsL [Spirochaetaceae bacterium]
MHKIISFILLLSIPLMSSCLIWQTFNYDSLVDESKLIENQQSSWVDANKRLIAGIAVLSSAERIEKIAKNELGLVKKQPEEVLQIEIEEDNGTD